MPKSNSPLFPPAAVPELKVRQLLLPTIPVLLLLIDNRPLLDAVPSPLTRPARPPVPAVLRPAAVTRSAPSPLVPTPMLTTNPPPRPAVATPDPSVTEPLFPDKAHPELSTRRPLMPNLPLFADITLTAPLLAALAPPARTAVSPPVSEMV